jgi:hypothetical protein
MQQAWNEHAEPSFVQTSENQNPLDLVPAAVVVVAAFSVQFVELDSVEQTHVLVFFLAVAGLPIDVAVVEQLQDEELLSVLEVAEEQHAHLDLNHHEYEQNHRAS